MNIEMMKKSIHKGKKSLEPHLHVRQRLSNSPILNNLLKYKNFN